MFRPFRVILGLLSILALACALRWHDLDRGLHSDEIEMIRRAFGESKGGHGNAQGYLPILRSSINAWGRSEVGARVPSAGLGVLTVMLTFFVGRRWFGTTAGLFAALLLACSMFHINMSQYVHTYALFGLGGLLIFHYLLEVAERGRTKDWIQLGIWSGLAVWIHHFGIFLLVSTVVTLGVLVALGTVRRPSSSWVPVVAGAATTAIAAPLILQTATQAYALLSRVLGSGEGGVNVAREPLFEVVPALFFQVGRSLVAPWTDAPGLVMIFWTAVAVGFLRLGQARWINAVPALTWCLVPIPLTVVFSYHAHMQYQPRRLIFLLPALTLIAGFAIAWVAGWARQTLSRIAAPLWLGETVVAVVVGTVLLAPLDDFYKRRRTGVQHWKEVASFLEAAAGPTDEIVAWPYRGVKFYYQGARDIERAQVWSPHGREGLRDEKRWTWLVLSRDSFELFHPQQAQALTDWAEANRPLRLDFDRFITIYGVGDKTADERVAFVQAAVAAMPSSCALRRTLAEALGELGNVEEGLRQYAHQSCGDVDVQLANELQAKRCEWITASDLVAAVECYDELIENFAPSDALLGLARAYRAQGDVASAESALRRAIDSGSFVEEATRELAWMLAEAGRSEAAIEAITLRKSRVSDAAEARLNLTEAQLLARVGEHERSRSAVDRAYLSLEKGVGWDKVIRRLYRDPAALRGAHSDFNLLRNNGGLTSPAFGTLVEALQKSQLQGAVMTRKYETAANLLLGVRSADTCEAIEGATVVAVQFLRRGDLLRRRGRRDTGTNALRTSADIVDRLVDCENTIDPKLLLRLGRLLSDSREHERAITQLQRSTSLAPKFAEGWANLCLAYRRNSEFERAADACRRTLALAPEHYYAMVVLAESQFALGTWAAAAASGERATELAGNEAQHGRSALVTARAYVGLGDEETACRILDHAENQAENGALARLSVELKCVQ